MSPHEFFLQLGENYRQPKGSSTWTGLVFYRGGFFVSGSRGAAYGGAIIDGLFFHHTPADDKDSHRVQPEICSTRLARS
jgi:hypothetical protein